MYAKTNMSRFSKNTRSPRKYATHKCYTISLRGISIEALKEKTEEEEEGQNPQFSENIARYVKNAFAEKFLGLYPIDLQKPYKPNMCMYLNQIEFISAVETYDPTRIVVAFNSCTTPMIGTRSASDYEETILLDKYITVKGKQHFNDKDYSIEGPLTGYDFSTVFAISDLLRTGKVELHDDLFEDVSIYGDKSINSICGPLIEDGPTEVSRNEIEKHRKYWKLNEEKLPLKSVLRNIPNISLAIKHGVYSVLQISRSGQVQETFNVFTTGAMNEVLTHFKNIVSDIKRRVIFPDELDSLTLSASSYSDMDFKLNLHFETYVCPVTQETKEITVSTKSDLLTRWKSSFSIKQN